MYGSLAAVFGLLSGILALVDVSLCIHDEEMRENGRYDSNFRMIEARLERLEQTDSSDDKAKTS